MTVILRKLERKRYWDNASWHAPEETQANVLESFSTTNNELSVYVLDEPETQIDRVVAALAVSRKNLAQMDIAVVPDSALADCDIKTDSARGKTLDQEVNGWHRNLVELTVNKVACFISAIKRDGKIKRCQERRVEKAIKLALERDSFKISQIPSDQLVQSLRKRNVI